MKILLALLLMSTCAFAEPDPDVIISHSEMNQDRINDMNERSEMFCSDDELDEVEELTSSLCLEKAQSFAGTEGLECHLTSVKAGLCEAICTSGSRKAAKLKIKSNYSCASRVSVKLRKLVIIRY